MRKMFYKRFIIYSMLIAIVIVVVSGILYVKNNLPDLIFVNANECTNCDFSIPVSVNIDNKEQLILTGKNKIDAGENGSYSGEYRLFGIISLKKTKVKVVEKSYAYPMGLPIGLYLKTQGVMIVNVGEFVNEEGKNVSPAMGKVNAGEYITSINGIQVSNKSQLTYLINESKNNTVDLTVSNDFEMRNVKVTPQKNKLGNYMLGIWVRDDAQGIGTLTYITENGLYGALGHGISDIDTGKLLSSHDGSIFKVNLWGINKGKAGKPGGLCGNIIYNDENKLGTISKNSNSGLNGHINDDIWKNYGIEKMEVALSSEIKEGPAEIQFIMDGKVERYNIRIKEINRNIKEKNMIIEVTDKDLLNKTNGIVQGMSGSPILQNGKLIGAVTHVLVNDPTKGYGIFIESMLER